MKFLMIAIAALFSANSFANTLSCHSEDGIYYARQTRSAGIPPRVGDLMSSQTLMVAKNPTINESTRVIFQGKNPASMYQVMVIPAPQGVLYREGNVSQGVSVYMGQITIKRTDGQPLIPFEHIDGMEVFPMMQLTQPVICRETWLLAP